MGLLLVTHDLGVAREVANDVAVMYAGRLVEVGPVRTVLDHAAHPYTEGLLGALPSPGIERGRLLAIPGQPPVAGQSLGQGCPFAPRCERAMDACRTEEPRLVALGAHRRVACAVAAPLAKENEVGSPRRQAAPDGGLRDVS
jgi:oligopeptide/dipeptide ABC transporter ATP-binding protein